MSLVSWHMLHEVLTGRGVAEPIDLDKPISTNPIHAVDVVLRHLPSMKWVSLETPADYILINSFIDIYVKKMEKIFRCFLKNF